MTTPVAGTVITLDSSDPQTALDTALTTLDLDPDDFLSALAISMEDRNTPAKIVILYGPTTGGGGGGTVNYYQDEFTATSSQSTFALSRTPSDNQSVFFVVNGVIYDDQHDYTISGSTVTWLNTLFFMQAGDDVIIKYI
jgi:hypothetical protein